MFHRMMPFAQVGGFVRCAPRLRVPPEAGRPLPLANWRFRWVPAEVLEGYSRKVANTALDARGYRPMTAREFALAEARGNPGASRRTPTYFKAASGSAARSVSRQGES